MKIYLQYLLFVLLIVLVQGDLQQVLQGEALKREKKCDLA